ncbi:tetratricopeptide repeat protein [Azospirillum rugosum]|uniref:TPR repeat methyltransferase n=1 Tax=Azospirillum rugosum TaxID=416170 RepID=A0ABS4SDQ3_9PROT|nr:tetratricopeptide repeat protein [Azospirillum rugosum]MBP2290622.1 putative TPR repeat methyltransferase [Azospirillum rugosum]MDQ0525510.1 putative TPR repeat methyltransferase [Azospirillum rugosum]
MSFDPTVPAPISADREGSPAPIPPGVVPDLLFQTGYDRLYADDPAGAARAFRMACAADPALGDAWAALADAAQASGDTATAVHAYGWAVVLDSGVWTWRVGLADSLFRAGRTADAVAAYGSLAAERPDAALVRLGLARALLAEGRKDEALEEFREAAALRPDDRDAALDLSAALIESGDALGAVERLQPLARRDPDDAVLHHTIGRAWIALREPDKALAALRKARDLDSEDSLGSAALIAALEAGEGADLSAAYVRALFDRYADRFDQDLVGKLGYAAPELLRRAVDRLGGGSGLRVLDLGCGTGLAGVAFRPLASHLAGVDLSPRMVDKARARALYDELWVGDVVAALDAAPAGWDLLVAADVLVYIGDLAPVFRAAAEALRAGGRFAATVERLDGEGFALGPTRRYAHAEAYLRATAEAAGLRILLLEPCAPRREKGVDVPGLLFVVDQPI